MAVTAVVSAVSAVSSYSSYRNQQKQQKKQLALQRQANADAKQRAKMAQDRADVEQNKANRKKADVGAIQDQEAGMGAGGKVIGGMIGFFTAAAIIPEPISSAVGLFGLGLLSLVLGGTGMAIGGFAGDELSGLNEKKRKEKKSIEGRADGGPVDAKKPYIVGEKGPELFSSDVAGMITPINFKKDSKISDAIASFEQSAQVTVIPLSTSEKGLPASASMTKSSSAPADTLPNIPSSDFANAFVGLSESMYNVMV